MHRHHDPDTAGAGALIPALALLAFSLPVVGLAAVAPDGASEIAVVGAPWADVSRMAEIVASADGAIVRVGGLQNVIVAFSEHPDFAARLRAAGAWLVLDPLILAACRINSERPTP